MTVLEVAHTAAAKALLTPTGLTVHNGKLPDDATTLTRPYVLLYSAVAWEFDNPNVSINHESSSCAVSLYAHCVADNDDAVTTVTGRVRAVWLDVVPTVAGRVCTPIRQVSVQPSRQDNSLGPAVLEALAIYEFESRPA